LFAVITEEAREAEEELQVLHLVMAGGEVVVVAAAAEHHSAFHSLDMCMEYEFATTQS